MVFDISAMSEYWAKRPPRILVEISSVNPIREVMTAEWKNAFDKLVL
ncbi:MAG: hypothetical protein NC081_03490 [Roseburia sp.]|nr:hypothetical protein [Roseburia sp.]